MCCEPHEQRTECLCSGERTGCGHSWRHFVSAAEKQEKLQEYKDQLKKELQGVEEHLQKLQGN